jgi:hypothetical protein
MGAAITGWPKRARIKTGNYTGSGIDNRDINIGINLAAKTNVWVVVKSYDNIDGIHRIEYGQGDLTSWFVNSTDLVDAIQALTATGFQIGTSILTNSNGVLYHYIVFWED